MIDDLPNLESGPTEDQLAFARAYLAERPMEPAILARIQSPDDIAARDAAKAERLARDWAGLGYYRRANAALTGRPVEVVFIGDSITEMWAVAEPDLFSDGHANRGISGQTSPQILLRFMADVAALKPRIVHLMCGINDVAGNTGPTTPADYQNNIRAMLDLALAHGIGVILAGLTPAAGFAWSPEITGVAERVSELNAWLAGLATRRGLVFADYHAPLAGPGGALRPELTRDGVHPTAAGYRVMRPICEQALIQARHRT